MIGFTRRSWTVWMAVVWACVALSIRIDAVQEPAPDVREEPVFWELLASGSQASLRGICAVSDDVCWVSGSGGTVLVTVDGGQTWKHVGPSGGEPLDWRDIEAWDERNAVIMSAGHPNRLLRTDDGGTTWTEVFAEPREVAFFDGMVFEGGGGQRGWLAGDPVEGRLYLLRTDDGGRTWVPLARELAPSLPDGVAAFAASGTCASLVRIRREHPDGPGEEILLIGLGGAAVRGKAPEGLADGRSNEPANRSLDESKGAGLLVSRDGGDHWELLALPIPAGVSAGVFSIAQSEGGTIVTVGGDFQLPDQGFGTATVCNGDPADSESWKLPASGPSGFRSAVVPVGDVGSGNGTAFLAVGPNGTDLTLDGGRTWQQVSSTGFHTISRGFGGNVVWAAGSNGRIGLHYLVRERMQGSFPRARQQRPN